MDDRFKRLEPEQPAQAKPDLPRLKSFEHLEIGAVNPAPVAPAPTGDDILCPHCGQANEKERDVCWACYKVLPKQNEPAPGTSPQDITLVLDGRTYHSTDKELPEDIRVLMQSIQKDGYSEKLLVDWRNWRATRNNAGGHDPKPGETEEIKVFQESRRSVVRLDGTLYYSDDPNLPPELKQLFGYLAGSGVTPELMTHLRQYGDKVKFRPHTTAAPSDGCVDFWNQVQSAKGRDWSADFPVTEAPSGVKVEREGEVLRITRRWLCLGTLRPLLALWVIFIFLGFASIVKRADPMMFYFLAAVLGVLPTYMTVARFINRTVIRLDPERLTVRHGPLPWIGARDIPTRDIDRLSRESEHVHDRRGVDFTRYGITLTLKSGEQRLLLSGLEISSEQISFITQQIESYLSTAKN